MSKRRAFDRLRPNGVEGGPGVKGLTDTHDELWNVGQSWAFRAYRRA